MNRGDHREPIFRDETDHQRFLTTLGEACAKTGWQLHAWCLMGNHFHLVVETPQANLIAGMKWLLGTWAHGHVRPLDAPALSAWPDCAKGRKSTAVLEIIWQYH